MFRWRSPQRGGHKNWKIVHARQQVSLLRLARSIKWRVRERLPPRLKRAKMLGIGGCPRPIPENAFGWPILAGFARVGLSLVAFLISISSRRGAPGACSAPGVETFEAGSCRLYGRGISSCLQMARTVPSLTSRRRGMLAIWCSAGLNQIPWAALSR